MLNSQAVGLGSKLDAALALGHRPGMFDTIEWVRTYETWLYSREQTLAYPLRCTFFLIIRRYAGMTNR